MFLHQEEILHAVALLRRARTISFDSNKNRFICKDSRRLIAELNALAVRKIDVEENWWQRVLRIKYLTLHLQVRGKENLVEFKLCLVSNEKFKELEQLIKRRLGELISSAMQRLQTHVDSFELERDRILCTDKYVRGSVYKKFLAKFAEENHALALDSRLLKSHQMASEFSSEKERLDLLQRFSAINALIQSGDAPRVKHNEKVMSAQAIVHAAYFQAVETSHLSESQINATLTMDDGNLTIAAAGSGKTSVIVAKAGLALKTEIFDDKEILILAFNKKAAKEIQERIASENMKKQLGRAIKVKAATFHSYGLRLWLKHHTSLSGIKRPKLLNFGDSDTSGYRLVVETIQELTKDNKSFQKKFFEWIELHRYPIPEVVVPVGLDAEGLAVQEDRYRALCYRHIRTKRKFWEPSIPTFSASTFVRSFEEARIFNWLHLRKVSFKYERVAPPWLTTAVNNGLPEEQHVERYVPDFTFDNLLEPNQRFFYEHFGLNAQGNAPEFLGGKFYVDRANHKRKALRKALPASRHNNKPSRFFETTSADFHSGEIFNKLADCLKERGIPIDKEDRTLKEQALMSFGADDELMNLAASFIAKFRDSGLVFSELRRRANRFDRANAERVIGFLDWIEIVDSAIRLKMKSGGLLDYAMMITEATDLLNKSVTPISEVKFVLVDEFQDISRSRAQLVQALLNQHAEDSMLYCVGDDWQAINRFAGSDIGIFKGVFDASQKRASAFAGTDDRPIQPRSTHLSVLDTTYRCDQSIASISREFVIRNGEGAQIDKPVNAMRNSPDPIIRIVEHMDDGISRLAALRQELHRIASLEPVEFDKSGAPKKAEVFVLTRNRTESSLPLGLSVKILKGLSAEFARTSIDVRWESMHRSKGLGRTYVVIVGMDAGAKGFPRDFVEDPISQLVLPLLDDAWDEERRLFYVGLTRAKYGVSLLCAATRPSIFVHELSTSNYAEKIEWIRLPDVRRTLCPSCNKSWLTRRDRNGTASFVGCLRYPFCGYRGSCEKHPEVSTI